MSKPYKNPLTGYEYNFGQQIGKKYWLFGKFEESFLASPDLKVFIGTHLWHMDKERFTEGPMLHKGLKFTSLWSQPLCSCSVNDTHLLLIGFSYFEDGYESYYDKRVAIVDFETNSWTPLDSIFMPMYVLGCHAAINFNKTASQKYVFGALYFLYQNHSFL